MFRNAAADRRRFLLSAFASAIALPALAEQLRRPADPRTKASQGEDDIRALVDRVSRPRLERMVTGLATFPTRWTPGPDFPEVERFVTEAFEANGAARDQIQLQPYAHAAGMTRHNILVGNPLDPRGVLLVGAHMDSTSEAEETRAPGANDNASGVSAVIEAHRILSQVPLRKGLVFVAFSGEEQGMLGSNACAAAARAAGWKIDMMLNLDMLGLHPNRPDAPMYVEYDQGNAVVENNAPAEALARIAAGMAAEHTTLRIEHTDIWDSDYMGFEAQGYPCIGFYDGGVDYPTYHSTTDVPEAVDFGRLEQATRLVVATLAMVGGLGV